MTDTETVESIDRSQRADARRNRGLLVDAARSVFAEFGPDAPLDEIARRAGVGIGTFYRHFPTRFDIQEAVMAEHVQWLLDEAEIAFLDPNPVRALESWLRNKMLRSLEYRGLGAAVWLAIADQPAGFNKLCHRMMERSGELLGRAQAAGAIRADIAHTQLLKMVNGIVLATEKSDNRGEDIELLFNVMMDGLCAPATRSTSLQRRQIDEGHRIT